MNGMIAELETYEESGDHTRESVTITEETLPELVANLARPWSASLWLRRESEELVLSGDRAAPGWLDFAHGGQMALHPRRHVVSAEAADDAALAFLRGRFDPAADPEMGTAARSPNSLIMSEEGEESCPTV